MCSHGRRAVFASVRASCLGSSFELEGDLRRFGKPTTVLFSVVSVAGRDYAFENRLSDPPGGLPAARKGLIKTCDVLKNYMT